MSTEPLPFDPLRDLGPDSDPLVEIAGALERARAREPFDPTPMSLATVDEDGRPSVRMVLLKGVDDRGLVFFTNRESRKARELDATRRAAVCIHWPKGEEQIRVEGDVERVTDAESDAYFASRPRASQIGAWASTQSAPLTGRPELVARVADVEARFAGTDVTRPPHWGGYRILPVRIELWFGRRDRLHDRFVWSRMSPDDVQWVHGRLFP